MEETIAQVDGLYQGDQQYWNVLGVLELPGFFWYWYLQWKF